MTTSIQWWKHQQAWLEDRSRFRLCLKARQCGMSTTVAAEALWDAVEGKTTVLASASERQSRELMRRCLKLLPLVVAASDGSIKVVKETAEMLELSTGGRVISVPASAATVQGYSASIVLDEAAWMANAEELWQALAPSITVSGEHRISVLSTPRGKGGLFYKLWNSADSKRWSRHRVTIDDAIRGGCQIDREELKAAIADEFAWRACFLCEFVDEQFSLLPFDLLQARTDDQLPYHADLSCIGECSELFAGFDVGRKHDLSVLALIERTESGYVSRGFIELRQAPFDEQEGVIEAVLQRANVHRLCIDASGIGLQLSERMKQRFGWKVEPVTFSLPVKEDLAARMLRVFQRGEIAIPADQNLLADLHSVEKQVTAAGNVRYAAPRSEGSHADRFMALALALHAAEGRKPIQEFVVLGESESDSNGEWLSIDNDAIWTPL